jgi:hypothetical protein
MHQILKPTTTINKSASDSSTQNLSPLHQHPLHRPARSHLFKMPSVVCKSPSTSPPRSADCAPPPCPDARPPSFAELLRISFVLVHR